ncbi:MAG: TonB-dependent receptor [Odoribacter sp.]
MAKMRSIVNSISIRLQVIVLFLFCFHSFPVVAQTIRGTVTDAASGQPIPFATVVIKENGVGSIVDDNGRFEIKNIPIGRYTVESSCVGYTPVQFQEVLVGSNKAVTLNFQLKELLELLEEVVIRPQVSKELPLNKMALSGARMLSVEEASRYAGGMEDPARLVTAFAGITGSPNSNGVSVHGNAPSMLQWKLEGVEVFAPNHFSDAYGFGAGVVSALSANVLGNSDFFSGAFPAEYSNSLAGVFDMKMRTGNNIGYEHTVQVGTMGIDLASEGPLGKNTDGSGASYLFNYRYSFTGLARQIGLLSLDGDAADYQDLNVKFNFPTKRAGTFSVFGLGLLDKAWVEPVAPNEWETLYDQNNMEVKQGMFIVGAGHKITFKNGGMWNTTIANSYFRNNIMEEYLTDLNNDNIADPAILFGKMRQINNHLAVNSSYSRKLSKHFLNKSGFTYTHYFFDLNMDAASIVGDPLANIYQVKDNIGLLTAYTSNSWNINSKITLNFGLNFQMFALNNDLSIEPRIGFQWRPNYTNSFSLGYGLHSKVEKMDIYFVKDQAGKSVNKNLKMTKSHHFQASYLLKITDNISLRTETYFQYLFNLPISPEGTYCVLNRLDYYVDQPLVSSGKGRNYGVDLTIERYLKEGYYWMLNGSIYKSEYRDINKEWHNTRFNSGYAVKLLGGKEWMIGSEKHDIFSVSGKVTFQGGMRYSPIDVEASRENYENGDPDIVYDEKKAFSKQFDPIVMLDLTVSYKMNRKWVSHEIAVKTLNLFQSMVPYRHVYNYKTREVKEYSTGLAFPNICYRINF